VLNDNDLSTTEAAALRHVNKSSITRAIAAGKINASKNEFGDWRIPRSELARYHRRHEVRQPVAQTIEQRFARVQRMLSIAMQDLAQLEAEIRS
jgi:excisionase family DNA binding protein